MIGTSRNRQTSKSLRVCSSMPPLAPLGAASSGPSLTLPRERGREACGDRGQGAIGVLAEIPVAVILVARRVEQVEGEPRMLEVHHRRGERDDALDAIQSERTRRRAPHAARLNLACELDRPAKQPFSKGSDCAGDLI